MLEDTPRRTRRFADWFRRQQTDPDPPAPPTGPRASALTQFVSASLRGEAPTEQAAPAVEPTADEDADLEAGWAKLGPQGQAALLDQGDPDHEAVARLYRAEVALAALHRARKGA